MLVVEKAIIQIRSQITTLLPSSAPCFTASLDPSTRPISACVRFQVRQSSPRTTPAALHPVILPPGELPMRVDQTLPAVCTKTIDSPPGLERQIAELAKTFHTSALQLHGHGLDACGADAHGVALSTGSQSSTADMEDDETHVPPSALNPGFLRDYADVQAPEPLLLAAEKDNRGTYIRTKEAYQRQDERYSNMNQDFNHHVVPDVGAWFHFNEDLIATQSVLSRILTAHPLPLLAPHTGNVSNRVSKRLSTFDIEAAGVSEHEKTNPESTRLAVGNASYTTPGTAASVNLAVAILVRHEHFINTVFRLASWIPHKAPLRLRSLASRISINNGGFHIGAAVSGVVWFVYYVVLLNLQFSATPTQQKVISYLTAAIVFDFALILCFALPMFRQKYHDLWELSHRFGGWAAVGLFWALTVFTTIVLARQHSNPVGWALVQTPAFWCLIFISYCLVYPWLHLRRHKLHAEKLSDHATRLWFGSRTPPVCVGARVATHPLTENHGFATISNDEGMPSGFSVIVSNAGDFTKKIINDPPKHIWTRGHKTTGVLRLISLFRPVVIVATGSGIGPCMSYFQPRPDHPVRIIWSAPSPEKTFGHEIIRSILKADPRAVIIDTKKTGRPDLVGLAWSVAQECKAEAVFIVSNPVVTTLVMDEIQVRGLLVYGPVFDS
nr:hypothetical protein CFP56_62098 [Quercus suber]